MNIIIENQIKEIYPDLRLGYIIGRNINNEGSTTAMVSLSEEIVGATLLQFPDTETLLADPLVAMWRKVYKEMGSKPGKYRPTVESLIRRLINGHALPQISKAVNAYLLAELQTLMPLGGYDLATLSGDIVLRKSTGDEIFIDFSDKEDRTYNGEIVYSDDKNVLTRRWNYRDCKATQITEQTEDFILVTEAPLSTASSELISRVLDLTKNYIEQFCGGEFEVGVVD